MKYFLRLREALAVSLASMAVITAFGALSTLAIQVPAGILTSPIAPAVPITLFEPAALAILHAQVLDSRWAQLERHAARPVAAMHLALVGGAAALIALGVTVQGLLTELTSTDLIAAFFGYVGAALVGRVLMGRLGWALVLGMVTLVLVAGIDSGQSPAWWAWPLATGARLQMSSGALLAVGIIMALTTRGRRAAGETD